MSEEYKTNILDKSKSNSKMVDLNLTIPIITLNANDLNTSIGEN